ncbi:hypothetical protein VNO77_00344 [Canavalia gladiata]|uniref:Inositol oxygenase n=1 Tax=Canavalia gladiata TaxID=3824 RepID=A0AAN9MUH7_CANGL
MNLALITYHVGKLLMALVFLVEAVFKLKGIYTEGCGLDNVVMLLGHDDYMYMDPVMGRDSPNGFIFVRREDGGTGFGLVIRDHKGDCQVGLSTSLPSASEWTVWLT